MKMTVIVTYRRSKKSKQMQFARVVEMTTVPERGDFITFTRVDVMTGVPPSPVLAQVHELDDRPVRFRVCERELFTHEHPAFGEAVVYIKPGNRAAQVIEAYVEDNSGESAEDGRTPEEAASNWMATHGLVPLPCLKELGQDKKWRTKTPSARDHYELAATYLNSLAKTTG